MVLASAPDVLLVLPELGRTGVPLTTLPIARIARDSGLRCGLFAKRTGPLLSTFVSVCAGPVIEAPNPWQRFVDVLRHRGIAAPAGSERRVARAVLRDVRPRSVLANSIATAEVASEAIRAGIPAALYVQELPPVLTTFLRAVGSEQLRRARLLANSESTRNAVAEALATHRDEIPVVYPHVALPVDPEPGRFEPRRPGAPLVLGAGSVSRIKGTDRFAAVADRLGRSGGAEFVWVGRRGALRRTTPMSRRADSPVRFLDDVEDLSPWLRRATVVLVTSRLESFCRLAVEALGHGAIVVATDVGGIREAVGEAAILVREGVGVEERLAAAVRQVLSAGPSERQRLQARGYERAEFFGGDRFERQMEQVLASLAGHGS